MGLKTQASHGLLTVGSLVFTILSLSLFNMKSVLFSGSERLGPFRWCTATLVPVFLASWAHEKKSLSTSGALAALLVGFIMTLANYSFLLSLLSVFITSGWVVKYREYMKKGENTHNIGKRNWLEVLSSCGLVLLLVLLHLFDVGSADLPIDFSLHYRASWFACAVLGCLSCSSGDSWAWIGSILTWGNPRLITNLCSVPRGTNGAVTLVGLVCSFLGGLLIGAAYYLGILLAASSQDLKLAPDQLNVILLGGLGGLLGSLIDSLLGAILQFSGQDTRTGRIVEVAGEGVIPICGKMVLDNRSVNLISSFFTALLLPEVAMKLGL